MALVLKKGKNSDFRFAMETWVFAFFLLCDARRGGI